MHAIYATDTLRRANEREGNSWLLLKGSVLRSIDRWIDGSITDARLSSQRLQL